MTEVLKLRRRVTGTGGAPESLEVGELVLDCVNGVLYAGINRGVVKLAQVIEDAPKSEV